MSWSSGPKIPLTILLLTTTLKSFEANDYIEQTCKSSQDYILCIAVLAETDPRPVPLAKRATEHALRVIKLTLPTIEDIAKETRDQVAKTRIGVCKMDYSVASQEFNNIFKALVPNAGMDSLKKVLEDIRKGSMAILDCERVYKTNKPVVDCPVSKQNYDVAKLMDITRIIVQNMLDRGPS